MDVYSESIMNETMSVKEKRREENKRKRNRKIEDEVIYVLDVNCLLELE